MVAPELQKVAARQAGRVLVVKVNTDALPDLGERFAIRSIPTLAVFAEGREVARTAGARPAADIEAFIDQAIHAHKCYQRRALTLFCVVSFVSLASFVCERVCAPGFGQ